MGSVGELAEAQGHHPDIFLAWGKVEITSWTHKIYGLTESDFIMAAKIGKLYQAGYERTVLRMTLDEARKEIISGIDYTAYRETESSLHDADKNRLTTTSTA